MHNITNLRNGETRKSLRPSGAREAEQPFARALESDDAVAEFLTNAVVERFSRERTHGLVFRDDLSEPETVARGSGEGPVDFRVLPAPDSAVAASSSVHLPTWKRILDLAIIFVALPFWLPLMILIMLAIKISSAGPVFYRQERVGYRGNRFMIFKFRTMKVNVDTRVHESHFERLIASDSPMTKLDAHGDPRLIKGGRFLRSAGLDELPQIFNVLRGEMSLVGARPCTVHEFERYQPWQRERVNGPPGMTGYWQVSGKNKTTFSEMIEMDIFYGKNMSVRFDLAIMLRTIPAIVVQVLETRGVNLWWKHSQKAKISRLA